MKTFQEFFASYGLSSQHVKMIAGLGLMVTCFTLVVVLVLICSRKLRDTQVRMRMEDNKSGIMNELFQFGGSLGLQSPKVLTDKLQPPRYDEVVTIDNLGSEDDTGLPSYWQASKGDTLQR